MTGSKSESYLNWITIIVSYVRIPFDYG